MIKIGTITGDISEAEANAYKNYMAKQHPEITSGTLDITVDGDEVDLKLTSDPVRFERIRRITGYLVGTLDRFNDAKRAEEADRVKHTVDREDDDESNQM